MVSPSYKPAYVYGGPTRAVADLCENLVKAGHGVSVYTTDANGLTNLPVLTNKEYVIDGVHVRYHHRWTKDHSNFSPSLLWRVLRDIQKYDVVHLISWWNLVTVPALLICILRRVRPVLSVHGTLSAYSFQHRKALVKKTFQNVIGKRLLSHAVLHVTTNKEKNEVSVAVPHSRIALIPNFIFLPTSGITFSKDKSCFHLLFVGRLDPVKNVEFLIDLLNEDWNFPIQLTIMGEGPDSYTADLQQRVKHNDKIVWLGNLDGDEKWRTMAHADLLVLPSRTENFGNVVIEALSQGTPVLISDQVGLNDYVLENKLGWVCRTEIEEWKKILLSIWRNSEERERIRQQAPAIIKKDFDERNLVKKYIEVYATVQNGIWREK